MNVSLIFMLIITVLFLLGFMYIEPILMKHKVKNDNEYGSARFSTESEIKKNFKKEKVNSIKGQKEMSYYDEKSPAGPSTS